MSVQKEICEEDVAEVVKFLDDNTQHFKSSLVTFLYNFYRLHIGIKPHIRQELSSSQEVEK